MCVRVERRQRAHRAEQHPHRVRVVPEPLEELRHVGVHVGVLADVLFPPPERVGLRQLALQQQVRRLEEAGLLRDLLDRVAAVAQDAGVAVDVGDGAPGGRGVDEALVVGGVAGLGQQRPQGDAVGSLSRMDDLQVKLSPPG